LVLKLHSLLEIRKVLIVLLADRDLLENSESFFLGLRINIFELVFFLRDVVVALSSENLLESLKGTVESFLALRLTDVAPSILNVWHGAAVDRFSIVLGESGEHRAR
jgi:hypothetical protein